MCVEVLDNRTSNATAANASISRAAEYVLSHNTCAKVIAMVAMRRDVNIVLDELLSEVTPIWRH